MFDHNRKVAAQIANLTKLIAARVVPSAPILLVPPISLIGPGLASYLVASHRSSMLVGRWVCSRCSDISWSGDNSRVINIVMHQ